MTARHPFSENTLQRRNHRPPHETHSAQAVETLFAKKCRKARWRVQRSEASAQERPVSEEIVAAPGSERQNMKSGITRARFGKRRRIVNPPTLSFSGNPVGLSCRGFRRQLAPIPGRSPRTRAGTGSARHPVPAHGRSSVPKRKHGRPQKRSCTAPPPRSGCGPPLYFTASQSCRCNGRNIAETSRSTSETRSFFFRFQALCRLLRIISTSVRISRPAPGRPSSPHRPARPMIMSDKTRRKTRRGKIRDRSV